MAQAFESLPQESSHIEMEKTGVIAGFLMGLLLAVSLVGLPMSDAGVPSWMVVAVVFALVAVSTRAGLALGRVLSHKG
jgi:cell shape-determining protein MreD